MNTINQRVLNDYLSIIREENNFAVARPGVSETDTGRHESVAEAEGLPRPVKGQLVDVRV